jgi:hypothetical protein
MSDSHIRARIFLRVSFKLTPATGRIRLQPVIAN